MRWRTRQVGDTRIVKGFLWFPRAMYRRLKQSSEKDPAGMVSKESETRWLERATWKQQWGARGLTEGPGWHNISWEDLPVINDEKKEK